MADLGKVVVTDGGNYSASVTYEKLTFVHYQGDAYMTLKTVKGVTPTDDGTNYKLFCKSAELATATKAGIVLPDGTTTTVDGNGKISVKKATTSAAGIVKPAATDFIMAADGTQKINTQFTQATELANIIAGEAIAQVWGKVSKAIATTMNLDQNTLLKNMISNIAVNDPDKLNSAAYIYTLVERIGMGTELAVGANLTDGLNKVNSDLGERVYYSDNVIALQSPVVNNVTYRFQVDSRSGGVILYKSEDNGINWTRNKEILSNADIQKGRVAALSCPANTITDHKLVFPKAFTVAPRVMLTLNSSTESPKYGSALPFTTSITTTGCTIRVANNSDTTFSPNIEWIAIAL